MHYQTIELQPICKWLSDNRLRLNEVRGVITTIAYMDRDLKSVSLPEWEYHIGDSTLGIISHTPINSKLIFDVLKHYTTTTLINNKINHHELLILTDICAGRFTGAALITLLGSFGWLVPKARSFNPKSWKLPTRTKALPP